MPDFILPDDQKTAMNIVCLYMAQSGQPHLNLGYETQTAALEAIADTFGVPKRTVQNERDSYDHFTDSERVGWKADALPARLQHVFDEYAAAPSEDLLSLAKMIMANEWNTRISETSITLPDLEECQQLSRERAAKIPLDQQYVPSQEVWDLLVRLYKETGTTDEVEVVGGTTLVLTTPKQNFLTISAQEIPRCWAVRPYVLAILAYEKKVDELAKAIGLTSRSSAEGKLIFKKLPSPQWEMEISGATVRSVKEAIANDLGLNETEQKRFLQFLSDREWSGVSKTLERTDWATTAIQGVGDWLAVASARRGELSVALAKSSDFENLMAVETQNHVSRVPPKAMLSAVHLTGGENAIFYGAPGTGKSNLVDRKIAGAVVFRTVFHPDLQNSDFFGCLKPRMKGDSVHYEFAAGPFMQAMAAAYKTPAEPVYLVIEELNRAAAAAVFGDLFLLLDRDGDGAGEYDVSFPSPESEEWFRKQEGCAGAELRLPSNLFIYATMNSADQGVYPIDTAFRRRWRQEYLPLEAKAGPNGKRGGPDGEVAYHDGSGKPRTLEWRDFVKLLNKHLTDSHNLDIAEDRLLGQWFVKANELDGTGIPEKVLLYLWDDLLRHEGKSLIFDTSSVSTYGALATEMEHERRFLSDSFLAALNAASEVEADDGEVTTDVAS